MNPIIPQKLKKGDMIRVIAPSNSMSIISQSTKEIANKRLSDLGFAVTFGKHVEETDEMGSSSISSRIDDLHQAFLDPEIRGVFAVIGGFNSNQLLQYIDWEIIRRNPKIFIGYSDTTALENSFFAKTGLVTYSGPSYSNFGQKLYFDYTLDYFKKCCMADEPYEVKPSPEWSDDAWYVNQEDRHPVKSEGWLVINEGKAGGRITGSNLCTFNLLQGTEYFPDLKDSIVFLEDDSESRPVLFDRDLQSLLHQPSFGGVRGLVVGRFQRKSNMADDILVKIIKTKKELETIPVIANVDFGHTDPRITFPIGGTAEIDANKIDPSIKITNH